jgi:hypothetical protein
MHCIYVDPQWNLDVTHEHDGMRELGSYCRSSARRLVEECRAVDHILHTGSATA